MKEQRNAAETSLVHQDVNAVDTHHARHTLNTTYVDKRYAERYTDSQTGELFYMTFYEQNN